MSDYEPDARALFWFADWVMRMSDDDCWLDAAYAKRCLLRRAEERDAEYRAHVAAALNDAKGG